MPNSLIPTEDMTTLQSIETVRSVAESAKSVHEMMQVAYAINNAANTGEYSVLWSGTLLESTISALQAAQYVVRPCKHVAKAGTQFEISWSPNVAFSANFLD